MSSVFVTNMPGSGGGRPYLACPYEHKGCRVLIYPFDRDGHIEDCPFNDGSVDLDQVFKEHARAKEEAGAKYAAKRARSEAIAKKYDTSHLNRSSHLYDPQTGQPIYIPASKSGNAKRGRELPAYLIVIITLAVMYVVFRLLVH